MDKKAGWTYQYVESLGMQIAVNDVSGILYTEDKIMYTVEEASLLKSLNYQLPFSVHLIKKSFSGSLISI